MTAVLELTEPADARDLGAFLGRARRFDPAALVRLRARPGTWVAAHVRLPFDVLVAKYVSGRLVGEEDVTTALASLADAVRPPGVTEVPLSDRRDAQWRGALPPPPAGWRHLDNVPVTLVRKAVGAGVEAFRATPAQATGEALLDHDTLTVSAGSDTAVVSLRVLHAAWRMGFLGGDEEAEGLDCSVSVAGSWTRLAAPYGSAYHQNAPLGLSPG